MALAYHILAHRAPAQVARLFRVLYHPDDIFIFHFDVRAPRALHHLGREWARSHPNVIEQTPRRVLWGGPQIPDLQVEAMASALSRSQSWSHFINLSGQDFPLRSRTTLIAQLAKQPRANFVSWFDPFVTTYWPNAAERLDHYYLHWVWLNRLLSLPGLGRRLRALAGWTNRFPSLPAFHRPRPDFFRPYGGSNHVVLSREGCAYLSAAPQARRIRRWLAHSAIPDESLFQTALLNSPLAETVVNRHCRHFEFHSDTPHPATLRAGDFDRLVGGDAWFARKFDDAVDPVILDRLEVYLGGQLPP